MSKIAIEMKDGTVDVVTTPDDDNHGYVVCAITRTGKNDFEVDITANASDDMLMAAVGIIKRKVSQCRMEHMLEHMPPELRDIADRLGITSEDYANFLERMGMN